MLRDKALKKKPDISKEVKNTGIDRNNTVYPQNTRFMLPVIGQGHVARGTCANFGIYGPIERAKTERKETSERRVAWP